MMGRLALGSVLVLAAGLLTRCSRPKRDADRRDPPADRIHRVPRPTDFFVENAGQVANREGYWKNHPGHWPVGALDLGAETHDQAEPIVILQTPPRGDASLILAKRLIAAGLNVNNGSGPGPVSAEMADADALLAGYPGRLPHGVHASTPEGEPMVALGAVLDDFNNEALTPGCVPDVIDIGRAVQWRFGS